MTPAQVWGAVAGTRSTSFAERNISPYATSQTIIIGNKDSTQIRITAEKSVGCGTHKVEDWKSSSDEFANCRNAFENCNTIGLLNVVRVCSKAKTGAVTKAKRYIQSAQCVPLRCKAISEEHTEIYLPWSQPHQGREHNQRRAKFQVEHVCSCSSSNAISRFLTMLVSTKHFLSVDPDSPFSLESARSLPYPTSI